jgi:dTMP kinase
MTGRFVAIEGPNGVGKTTVTAHLAMQLRMRGHAVHTTAEPSRSPLGSLVRAAESYLSGRALGLAVAADRYAHIEHEISPALDAGMDVISHRYVQSSLVLQRLDGLSLAEIWRYNAHVMVPAMSVYLEEAPEVIATRLSARPELSRLELRGSPARELALYEDAFRFLARRGWPQVKIDCHDLAPDDIAAKILGLLDELPQQETSV